MISYKKCVGINTDDARSTFEKFTGLIEWTRKIVPLVTLYHCCLYRKIYSKKLKEVLDEAVKILNFIKAKALNSKLFNKLCIVYG